MAASNANDVFLNVPFDRGYEQLFVTLVGTLVFLGQEPHCVLEVREQGDGRLQRIFELMTRCPMSIHDMSRVGTPVRFNMPFELGLACAIKLARKSDYQIFVLDTREFRLDKALSDYKGRDPLIHGGTCDGMVASLLNLFVSDVDDAPARFRSAARLLRKSAQVIKKDSKVQSIFHLSPFRRLVATAVEIAVERSFINP